MTPNRNAGFTLLEIMVALAITGVVATMAYQGLSAASAGAERSREILAQVNELDRAWQILAADMRHLLPPEVGPTGVRFEFQAQSLEGGADVEQRLMLFVRRNWFNPMQRPRSDLQEVSYRIENGTLWRDYRPYRNMPFDEFAFEQNAAQQELLGNVESIEIRFLSDAVLQRSGRGALDGDDYTRDWAPAWPDPNQVGNPHGLPRAVQIRIEIEGVGVSERLFDIVGL
ncbi:type II secretion system minor pseudopilin GspJ [Marinimicrobium sp. ABcell2]|uniref:type II secretion system minor pseudopilin GspJ n=1 Tax=Marinimicrobium sp. ABcell2 TaxID=3069751 RepID=UPI0027B7F84D|nr:type II secretion system minor pseudopilin GspJ [Marinimicrobium sp. ABcell2]MDQ2076657.1 type II secretion system minor pseudopilin GspJ [Marinimicrobium sp. ABcell2]